MSDVSPTLVCYDDVESSSIPFDIGLAQFGQGSTKSNEPLSSNIGDFYLTNPIARSSSTMAKCSVAFSKKSQSI